MGRDDRNSLDSDALVTTEPQLHTWDEEDPDAAAYADLHNVVPMRPREDG